MFRLLLPLALAFGMATAAQAGPEPFRPHPWCPEVGEPLLLYRNGQYAATLDLALRIARGARQDAVRRDAAALEALCLLRGESRDDRIEGRQRLLQLAAEAPSLRTDPDCNLALGLAQIELHETADALDRLDRTLSAFREAGRADGQRAALVALAAAWAAHTEWELTVGRLLERPPADAAEAERIRIARIREVQARLRELPQSEADLDQVDLIVARRLVECAETRTEGREILARLAARDPLSGAAADAALALAELLQREGEAALALALYERLERDAPGQAAPAVQSRIEALRRAELVIDAPRTIRCGEPLAIDLFTRGLRMVRLEVREVDLERWLAGPQMRGVEASLPEAGRVIHAADLAIEAAAVAARWSTAENNATVRVNPPAGALVIVARGRDVDGGELVARQLLLVTDLNAACLIGSSQALVWVTGPDGALPAGGARFWMQHSFAPTEAEIKDGLAQFALPAESAVMRDRGWFCLIRVGDQVALCRGSLSSAPPLAVDRTLLVCGPPVPGPDEPLTIAGLYRSARDDPNAPRATALRVTNAMNDVLAKLPLAATPGGAVQAVLEPARDRTGRAFRITVHEGQRTIENAAGRLAFQVADRDPHRLSASFDPVRWIEEDDPTLHTSLQVRRPWGDPAGGLAQWQLELAALPVAVGTPVSVPRVDGQATIDRTGWTRVDASAVVPKPVAGPVLAQLGARAVTTDNSVGLVAQSAVRNVNGSHVWIELDPAKPEAGRDAQIRLGAFFPCGWPLTGSVRLRIERPDREVEVWTFQPGARGFEIPRWRPIQPGTHRWWVEADRDASPAGITVSAAGEFTVDTPADTQPVVGCRAELAPDGDHECAEIALVGQSTGPVLLVVEDGDILGARALRGFESRGAPIRIPLREHSPRAVVHVLDARLRTLAWATAARRADQRPSVAVEPAFMTAWPGETATLDVLLDRAPPGSVLVVRLISSSEVGLRRASPPGVEPWGLAAATSLDDPGAPRPRLARPDSAEEDPLLGAMLEGETLWCWAGELTDDRVTLNVPLPRAAGRYHLLVAVETPGGEIGRGAAILDTHAGLQANLSTPVRLEVGDQTCIGLELVNLADQARHVELRLDADKPLELRRCTGLADATWRALRDEHAWTSLTLVPGITSIRIDVVASEPGDAAVRVALRGDDGETEARAACVVREPVRVDTAEPPLPIQREVTVWTPPRPDAVLLPPPAGARPTPIAQRFADAGWRVEPWTPGMTLHPGQALHVVETIKLEGARPPVAWRQLVPATCIAWRPAEGAQRLIGTPEPPRDAMLAFRTNPLQPGALVHEYVLGVSRPGDCRLPAPDLDLLGRPLRVAVTPAETRLVVTTEAPAVTAP